MFTKRELLSAIKECENAPANYQNVEKLAHLYTVYDHLYTMPEPRTEVVDEVVVGDHGDSNFFKAVNGADAAKAWSVVNELMDALAVLNPKLYENVLSRLGVG